jgi:hypothetical protein
MDDATAARRCDSWEELCLFLDGSPSSFTGMLLTLIEKAEPVNRRKLRQEFPRKVAAWETWREIAPCTWGELEAATAARLAEPAWTQARTVTYDLSDTDTAHVLDTALKDYANQAEDNARHGGGESFTRWAAVADRMRAQAEAAGS